MTVIKTDTPDVVAFTDLAKLYVLADPAVVSAATWKMSKRRLSSLQAITDTLGRPLMHGSVLFGLPVEVLTQPEDSEDVIVLSHDKRKPQLSVILVP